MKDSGLGGRRILVVAPHMDDEVLGTGGTICRHVDSGDQVGVIFLANRVYGHHFDERVCAREEEDASAAMEVLGYESVKFLRLRDERLSTQFEETIDLIEAAVAEIKPNVVYISHGGDPHQDHQSAFKACQIALRSIGSGSGVDLTLAYEVPSSTDQAFGLEGFCFLPNYFVNIEQHIERKIRALECYSKESRRNPHPRSAEGVRAYARFRGLTPGFQFAEAFSLARGLWR